MSIREAFIDLGYFYQIIHHMAVSGCTKGVYCCFSSRNQAVIRMVLLSTSESFIEFYVRQLNAFSVHLYRSAKFIASHQDIQAMKSLKQAFVEYENDHPLTNADHGIKPVIVAHGMLRKMLKMYCNLSYLCLDIRPRKSLPTERF